jgi:hypothetical protein
VTTLAIAELNLRNNAVGAEGAQALAIVLSCNKNLKKLNLYWNNIRNKGLRAICDNLPPPPLAPDYRVVIHASFRSLPNPCLPAMREYTPRLKPSISRRRRRRRRRSLHAI